jgi:hypothetical protein
MVDRALPDFTPRDVLTARYELNVFCETCRVLRPFNLAPLIAAGKGDVRLADLRFRCHKCSGLGSAFLTWRDKDNDYRSFDFATGVAR